MIGFAESTLGILVATLIPAYLALYLIPRLIFIPTRYIAAAGLGLTLWFFFDTMGDATEIGVNYGLSGGTAHAGLIVSFLAGIATLATFDYFSVPTPAISQNPPNVANRYSRFLVVIPIGIATVMGIHGLGEGWDFASSASAATGSLISSFGGNIEAVSYILHKFFEASIIATAYTCFFSRVDGVRKVWWYIPVLGILFGGTTVIGAAIGYYVSFDTTYFYAFGVTSAFYAALRLAEATNYSFKVGSNAPTYLGSKIFIAVAIGFFLLYVAALLHS